MILREGSEPIQSSNKTPNDYESKINHLTIKSFLLINSIYLLNLIGIKYDKLYSFLRLTRYLSYILAGFFVN